MDCFRRLPFVSVMLLMPMFFPLAFFPYLTSAGSLSMAHPNPWKPGRVRDTRLQIWFIRAGWFAWRGRKLPVGWSAGFTMTANDCWKWRNATPLKLVSEFSIRQRHEKQVQWVTGIFWLVIGKVFEMYIYYVGFFARSNIIFIMLLSGVPLSHSFQPKWIIIIDLEGSSPSLGRKHRIHSPFRCLNKSPCLFGLVLIGWKIFLLGKKRKTLPNIWKYMNSLNSGLSGNMLIDFDANSSFASASWWDTGWKKSWGFSRGMTFSNLTLLLQVVQVLFFGMKS